MNKEKQNLYNECWTHPRYTGTDQTMTLIYCGLYRTPIDSIIDFGCGNGRNLDNLFFAHYYGVDISSTAVNQINERLAKYGKRFNVWCHDLENDSFYELFSKPRQLRPLGICFDVLEHIHPHRLEYFVRNILSNCNGCWVKIALFEDGFEGKNVHEIVWSGPTWLRFFSDLNLDCREIRIDKFYLTCFIK